MKYLSITLSFCLIIASSACSDHNNPKLPPGFTLTQTMDSHDAGYWTISDGWSNGAPFLNGWCSSQVGFANGQMILNLENTSCSSTNYAGAEYRTNDFYGYGYYEVRMKAASGAGVVSSFFTYTGPSDGNPHDEIDIEFLGQDTNKMQVNYWVNGVEHPVSINLGFDAAADFHTYAFEWRSDRINWYVDGSLVHSVNNASGPLPSTPGRIMANIWACDAVVWCGQFNVNVLPGHAAYDFIGFRR
ncbi:MAG: glycoside hydrolase family 16 protein [Gammaproteobacteria bacterium]|nr:glycoside hydrolase family 16 protein [Gammaproteobacteria bacterium]